MIGMFARSKAGHDQNKLYIIIEEENEYVYLVDGIYKTVQKPKKKQKKHIQIIKKDSNIALKTKMVNKQAIFDEEIKRAIKLYKKEHFPSVN